MLARLCRLNGIRRQISPAPGERCQNLYGLRHIALAAAVILFPTTRLRLLTTQVKLRQRFTQGEDLLHQRPEAGEIEIVELIKLLYPGVTAINQIAQALFQSFQLQLAGRQLRVTPRGNGALALQPGGDSAKGCGVIFLLKRRDDGQEIIVKGFLFETFQLAPDDVVIFQLNGIFNDF